MSFRNLHAVLSGVCWHPICWSKSLRSRRSGAITSVNNCEPAAAAPVSPPARRLRYLSIQEKCKNGVDDHLTIHAYFHSIGKCAYGIKKFRETALRRKEDAAYPPQADGFASEFLFMNCLPAIIPPFFRPDL